MTASTGMRHDWWLEELWRESNHMFGILTQLCKADNLLLALRTFYSSKYRITKTNNEAFPENVFRRKFNEE